jgi:hypothetical protein
MHSTTAVLDHPSNKLFMCPAEVLSVSMHSFVSVVSIIQFDITTYIKNSPLRTVCKDLEM